MNYEMMIKLVDALYRRGYKDAKDECDYDPRGCAEWQSVVDAVPVECRTDGRCQYAIDHGAEGLGACPMGECAMPISAVNQKAESAIRTLEVHGFRYLGGTAWAAPEPR